MQRFLFAHQKNRNWKILKQLCNCQVLKCAVSRIQIFLGVSVVFHHTGKTLSIDCMTNNRICLSTLWDIFTFSFFIVLNIFIEYFLFINYTRNQYCKQKCLKKYFFKFNYFFLLLKFYFDCKFVCSLITNLFY